MLKTTIFIFVITILSTMSISYAGSACKGNVVTIEAHLNGAQELVDALRANSRMPLNDTEITDIGLPTTFSTITARLNQAYADSYGMNSFDIAKLVTDIAGANGPWNIYSIKSQVHCSPSNP